MKMLIIRYNQLILLGRMEYIKMAEVLKCAEIDSGMDSIGGANITPVNNNKNAKIITVLFITIVVIQTVLIIYFFANLKQGFHSDEVFNYAIANSAEFTDMTKKINGDSLMDQWLDSGLFLEYISASKNHRFDYSVPMTNAANDLNPPFQYLILHTICSFFPETFSWYYCFAINILTFIISQFYLYRLVKGMTKNDVVGIAAILMYGFGIGAMSSTIYIRIYAVAVMFSIMFAFYSYKFYELRNEHKIPIKYFVGLFFSCLLGALTLHLFLMIAFCITLGYSLYFLFSKRIKTFLLHGFCCLLPVLLSIAIVPNTFKHVGGINQEHSFSRVSYPFLTDLRLYLYTLTKDLFGIHVLPYENVYFVSALVFLGAVVIFLIPIVILVKKEKWFIAFLEKLKGKAQRAKEKSRNFCYPLIPLFICITANILVVAKWTSYYYMGKYSSRYIFTLYPLAVAFSVSLIYFIIQLILERKKVAVGILLGLCVIFATWTHFTTDCWAYLFLHEEEGITFGEIDKQADAREIIVFWDKDAWILACMAPELYHTDQYYATTYSKFQNEEVFKDIDTTKPYYLLVDQAYILPEGVTYEDIKGTIMEAEAGDLVFSEEDFLAFYNNLDCIDHVEYAGKDAAFGRNYKIYRLVFN